MEKEIDRKSNFSVWISGDLHKISMDYAKSQSRSFSSLVSYLLQREIKSSSKEQK